MVLHRPAKSFSAFRFRDFRFSRILRRSKPHGIFNVRGSCWAVEECARYWTDAERQDLFQSYFDSTPLLCPVCLEILTMRMVHTREVVALAVRCQGCGNAA